MLCIPNKYKIKNQLQNKNKGILKLSIDGVKYEYYIYYCQ